MERSEFEFIRRIGKRISELEEKIEQLRAGMESCTQILSDMPKGGEMKDKLAEGMAKLLELQAEISPLYAEWNEEYDRLEALIDKEPDKDMQAILIRRYILDWPWKMIAKYLSMSIDSVKSKDKRYFNKKYGKNE